MVEVYLNNAATSWPKPEVVYRAVDAFLRRHGASQGRGGFAAAGRLQVLLRTAAGSWLNFSMLLIRPGSFSQKTVQRR